MEPVRGRSTATALILAGLGREAVVRGLRVELDLTVEEAEAAWTAAMGRLGEPTAGPDA